MDEKKIPYKEIEPEIVNLVRLTNQLPFLQTDQSCGGHLKEMGCQYRLDPPTLLFYIDGEINTDRSIKYFVNPLSEGYIHTLQKICQEKGFGEVEPIGIFEGAHPIPLYHFRAGKVEYTYRETAETKRKEQLDLVKEIEKATQEFIDVHF